MIRIRGISNLAGTQSSNSIARLAASTSSSSFFANATRFLIPAIPEYLFVSNPMELASVTFSGDVIAGENRISFLSSADPNRSVAGSEKNPQFEDRELIDYFKTQEARNKINIQNVRKPVHILADFDYATLNRSLDPIADPDPQSRNQMSGAARIWARNENAKEWKEWVAACFFTELALGANNQKFRSIAEDSMSVDLTGSEVELKELTENAYYHKESMFTIRNIVNGYYGIYLSESFMFDVFRSNPFRQISDSDIEKLESQVSSLRALISDDEEIDFLEQSIGLIKNSFNLKRNDNSKILPDEIIFGGDTQNSNDDLRFKLHDPGDEQGFIKSTIEVTRAIGGYLKDYKFYYRNDDINQLDWKKSTSFNEYYPRISVRNILPDNEFFNPGKNVYEKAFKIRKIILKSLYIKDNSEKMIYLKDLKSEEGKLVIGNRSDLSSKDDIEKTMCRVLSISPKDYVTISPYLTEDYMTVSSSREVNNFLTLKDSLEYKKYKLLDLTDAFFENRVEDSKRIKRELKKFTFDYGPEQLSSLMEQLQFQFCPVSETSSSKAKNALVLLDHNNIVAHLTHGKVGQFIMDAALEKINLINHRNDPSDLSYEIKIVSRDSNAGLASYDLLGNRNADVMSINIETGQEVSQDAFLKAAFTSDSSSVSLEFSRILNSTFIKSLSSPRRKEYIFFCILLQLSDLETNPTKSTPYFLGIGENDSSGVRKLPGIADALYSEYFNRILDQSFTVPGNKVGNFFEEAGVTSGATQAFSRISSSDKSRVNNFLLDRMREACLGPNSGGPLGGAFEDIISLQDRISHIPLIMDLMANSYREIILDVADRLTSRITDSTMGDAIRGRERINALRAFFLNAPANRQDSWSLVLQDFVRGNATQAQGNDSRNPADRRTTSAQSDIDFTNGVPDFSTNSRGEVIGISGIAANKNARATSGFASVNINEGEDINDGFKDAALMGIKDKVLNFDRETNILINLSENICAILFYGFPNDSEDKMFNQEFMSSFHKNDDGILNSIGLLSSEGKLEMTSQEIFDVVWGYCTIADQLLNHIPGVKMKFDFKNSIHRENYFASPEDEVYREADDVYNLEPALDSLGDLNSAITTLRTRANRYLPPDVMSKIPSTTSKNAVGGRDYQQQPFGAGFGDTAEANRRKTELVNDMYDLAARAAVFFKQADKEVAKEPQFSLKFLKEDNESNNVYELMASGFRLGFLPHLAIDSDYARHHLIHMDVEERFLNSLNPSEATKEAVDRLVGLKPIGDTYETASGRTIEDPANQLKFSMIRATNSSPDSIIPREIDRVSYFEGVRAFSSSRYRRTRTSMLAYPKSCFGFVYSLNSDYELRDDSGQYAVSDDVFDPSRNRGMVNQFSSPESEEIIEQLKLSTKDSLNSLNNLYSNRLAITPPSLYRKLVEKVPALHEFIGGIKSIEDPEVFELWTSNLGGDMFEIVPLRQPVHRKRKKITIEMTVVKESYQFIKALKADTTPHAPVTETIRSVQPCNATFGTAGYQYPSDFYGDLLDVLSTFFKGEGMSTIEEFNQFRDEQEAQGNRVLNFGPYYDYVTTGKVAQLNRFGEFVSAATSEFFEQPLNIIDYNQLTFGWQFDLFCRIMSHYETLITGDPGGGHGTSAVSPTLDGIAEGVDRRWVGDLIASYDYGHGRHRRFSADLDDWTKNWPGPPEDFDWQDYFYFISASSTNPNPWFIRADHEHYPTAGLPTSYYTSTWPYSPVKSILGTRHSGNMYIKLGPGYSHRTKINESIDTAKGYRPEFFSANRTGLKTKSEKIKVEIYLVKGRNGNYTHYSTEPVFEDESNHPSLKEINNLYDGRGFDSRSLIVLRPSSVATTQYKFSNQDPKYLGPIVPGNEPPFPDNYFVNESLPFLVSFDWGTQLNNALRSVSLEDWEDIDETNNPKTKKYEIPTETFLGITQDDMDDYFRQKADEMYEAEKPRALSFLNRFRNVVENYINTTSPTVANEQRDWLREMVGKYPYFYDWRIQFPSLEVDIKLEVENHVEKGDLYLDLDWRKIRGRDLQDDSPAALSFKDITKKEKIKNIYNLEKDYLDYVISLKEYANNCSATFETGMSLFSKSVKFFSNLNGLENLSESNNLEIIEQPNLRTSPEKTFLGNHKRKNVLGEVKRFVENNGFLSVTPDTLASLDSLRRLYLEQFDPSREERDDHRSKSHGMKMKEVLPGITPAYSVQIPFKVSPYDIRVPYQRRPGTESPTKYWQEKERSFSNEDDYGKAALDSNFTRVCFVGVESGELQRIIDSPISSYGDYSQDSINSRKQRDRFGPSLSSAKKFQVKLELFDFFNPWLKFEYTDDIVFSREKPYRIMSLDNNEPSITRSHKNSPLIRNILGEEGFSQNDRPTSSNFTDPRNNRYDFIDVFLKAYASKVLGLDFFSFMIPRRGSTPPVSDFVHDSMNQDSMLPEERNYQEYLNEYTEAVFHLISEAESNNNFEKVRHLIKFFFDRHVGASGRFSNLEAASSIAGSNLSIKHYDEHGRSTLMSGESGFGGLFTNEVIDKSDSESPKFFPYRFSKPVTETSLAAAEILTSINEYSPHFMREFRHGFAFDRVVGIPYKMSNFKISRFIRTELSGETIDLSGLDVNDYDSSSGKMTDEYFAKLKKRLTYLDPESEGGVFVAEGVLYPLSLRARICKIEDN